ncbi:phage late control D family protein [Phenylobacterium immobile]|uniref:phage late control D family protein n=1 Tax=Phenylobacterium immobile TaxID=21 RepID=UPI000ADE977D|nr:contractile injection system protein, VgrG/Pvc8 family [Phenylobacterium immobile]
MADGSAGIAQARPTILVGDESRPELASGLFGLTIDETTEGLHRCEALLGNWGPKNGTLGFLYFDRATLDFGKRLRVKLGDDVLFDGRITGLEARFPEASPPQLVVLAEDRLQDLRKSRRSRTFEDVTDADVFGAIAGDHDLTPQIDVEGPTHRCLAQINQSDLAFLRDRARAIGAEVWVEDKTLHVATRDKRRRQPATLALNGRLREFSVIADIAGQATEVAATGWDIEAKTAILSTADDSVISGELTDGVSGASVLREALQARRMTLAHTTPATEAEARAMAEGWFRAQARRFVVGRGVADADARLRVGGVADLRGLGPLFEGEYYLAQTRHRFDTAHGFRTEFTGERANLGRAA